MTLRKIISGGQTGADEAGLAAGKELGLETGGWMPKGWLTEDGPRPEFRQLYGMREHESPKYQKRTWWNANQSSGTLIIGDLTGGTKLTISYCDKLGKPWIANPTKEEFWYWLKVFQINVLNVAGNRESKSPGIFEHTKAFMLETLR